MTATNTPCLGQSMQGGIPCNAPCEDCQKLPPGPQEIKDCVESGRTWRVKYGTGRCVDSDEPVTWNPWTPALDAITRLMQEPTMQQSIASEIDAALADLTYVNLHETYDMSGEGRWSLERAIRLLRTLSAALRA